MSDDVQELPFKTPPRRTVGKRTPVAAAPKDEAVEAPQAAAGPAELKSESGVDEISRVFMVCLAVGTLAAPLGLMHNPLWHWIGVLGPVGATAAYPLIGRARQYHRSSADRDRFADNCYYLGFIFTQVALLVGFAPVMLFNAQLSSQDVLRAFSMALGAALVGLVARTIFTQASGHSLSSNRKRIEDDVEAMAAAVSRQAAGVVGEFEQLSGQLRQAYGRLDAELADCVGSLVKTVKFYDKSLAEDMQVLQTGGAAVAEVSAESVALVQAEQRKFVAELQAAVGGIDALHHAARQRLVEATQVVQTSSQALAASANSLGTVADLGGHITAMEGRMGAAAQAAQALEAQLTTTAQRVSGAEAEALASVATLGRQMTERTMGQAKALEQELTQSVQLLERTLANFKAELERIRV